MNRFWKNLISVVFTLMKFSLVKVFHWNTFDFHLIERFSPNTHISFLGKGKLKIGKFVRVHTNVRLIVSNNAILTIDDNVAINYGCIITARNLIHIKAGVEFGPNVLIYDHDHDFRAEGGLKSRKFTTGRVIIGENSWIGANTVILKDTIIGANCVVGAGSVLKGTYQDNTLIMQKRETTTSVILTDSF